MRFAMLLLAWLVATGPVQARFLSVDPVPPDAEGGHFHRYRYADAGPYRFVDPDGRRAIVTHRRDGSVSVELPMRFTGPMATPERIAAFRNDAAARFSGTWEIDGVPTRVDFAIVEVTRRTPRAARNTMRMLAGPTSEEKGRSFVDRVGGRQGEVDMTSAGIPHGEVLHEIGHYAGIADRYDRATGRVHPGWSGNLMGQLPGAIDSRNIVEMLRFPGNIVRREAE